jgi:nicotinate dehydrogenase subunit A
MSVMASGEGCAVELVVNGKASRAHVLPGDTLLDLLRDGLGLTGTRPGCRQGQCGACHAMVDGRALASCDYPAEAAAGREVVTVEGLEPHMAQAFIDAGAAQCGYCIPGMMVAAQALLAANPDPTVAQVRGALERHLCRCGVHRRIEAAVLQAARCGRLTAAASTASPGAV